MAKRDFNVLKDRLYTAFELAMQYGTKDYGDDNNDSHQAAAQSFLAAAAISRAILALEQDQRETQESKGWPLKGKDL